MKVSLGESLMFRLIFTAIMVVGLSGGSAIAQTSTSQEIDNWMVGQLLNRSGDVGSTAGQSVQDEDEDNGVILGSWRNVYLRKTFGPGQEQASFNSVSQERAARFGNVGSRSLTRVFWDGSQRYTKYAGVAENRDAGISDPLQAYVEEDGAFFRLVPSVQGPGSAEGGSINPNGLSADLTGSCPGNDRGLFLILDQTDQGTVTYTIDVFSPNDETDPNDIKTFWSRATVAVDSTTPTTIFGFYFDTPSFGAPGPNDPYEVFARRGNGGPADFENVGAVMLTASISTTSTDVPIGTPIVVGCGTDFGDAPNTGERVVTTIFEDVEQFGSTSCQPRSSSAVNRPRTYRTLVDFADNFGFIDSEIVCQDSRQCTSIPPEFRVLECDDPVSIDPVFVENLFDPETRAFRGPHHLINGPFLGLFSNDTDAEFDGQPNETATGDDGDEVCDEEDPPNCTGGDDEQALETPPVFFADFIVNGDVVNPVEGAVVAECAGLDMTPGTRPGVGPNTYCVALQVSNPTDRWAQVVGWIDFRGNGAFDNRCGGGIVDPDEEDPIDNGPVISDGTVTYESNLRNCERSASRVFIGDLSTVSGSGAPENTGLRDAGENPIGLSCQTDGFFGSNEVGAVLDEEGGWTGGNVPPGCEGVVVLTWNLDEVIQAEQLEGTPILTSDNTFSRFRISTDRLLSGRTGCGFFQEAGPTPYCYASDGEVEDHMLVAGTVPVSISSFGSRDVRGGLEVSWTTVSETENIGFHIWGDLGEGLDLLTPRMIESTAEDLAQPNFYTAVLPGLSSRQVKQIAITAVDNRGREEMYGLYEVGEDYGREAENAPINWARISQQAEERLALLGVSQRAGQLGRHDVYNAVAIDFSVTDAGLQRIYYEDLRDAGLDLMGVNPYTIAVTLKGAGVPRHVVTPQRQRVIASRFGSRPSPFGPGSYIEFWGEKPALPDALYVENYVYRVTVDGSRAISASQNEQSVRGETVQTVTNTVIVDEDRLYNPSNPNPDPFFVKRLRANTSDSAHSTALELGPHARLDRPAEVLVRIGGSTSFPANPDHHVRIAVNGQVIKDYFFNGAVTRLVRAEVPAGLLVRGENIVTVSAPGQTAAPMDHMFLDSVAIRYDTNAVANRGFFKFEHEITGSEQAVNVSGFRNAEPIAYAWDGAMLHRLGARSTGAHVIVPLVAGDSASYWVGDYDAANYPSFVRAVGPNDIFNGRSSMDFVVITHPAFMPAHARENHPLNQYIAHRQAQGWNVRLFDILEIQKHYGGGMPLPMAVTRFLREASEVHDFEHVLLVGDGNYDHLDKFGQGAISFIPTIYRATSRIRHTPADAMMADLTGNGLPDKAVGRWPVRTLDDLRSVVTKTLDWDLNADQIEGAVWVTGRQGQRDPSFSAQTSRMSSPLIEAGWPSDTIDRIVFEEAGGAAAARTLMVNAINAGRAVTGFSGHAAPTMWSFDGLFTSNDVRLLDNVGRPTLIGTKSCYTSYAVSPFTNTLAHRLMNGYKLNSKGEEIPGFANGAVGIHGPSTLSTLAQNETVARRVLEYQLQGYTLGQAVELGRAAAAERNMSDQVINWTLLGDPTLILH